MPEGEERVLYEYTNSHDAHPIAVGTNVTHTIISIGTNCTTTPGTYRITKAFLTTDNPGFILPDSFAVSLETADQLLRFSSAAAQYESATCPLVTQLVFSDSVYVAPECDTNTVSFSFEPFGPPNSVFSPQRFELIGVPQ